MKTCMAVTVERNIFKKIENLRGREKRSTFVEHILLLGINEYEKENMARKTDPPLNTSPRRSF